MLPPNPDRLDWDDHHMLMALLASWRSPDPNTSVGACLVDSKNRIISTGYNGFPCGIPSNLLPCDREAEDPIDTKYAYVCHAEHNALANAQPITRDPAGYSIYCTLYPCNICATQILQSYARGVKIRRVVYLDNKYKDLWQTRAAAKMFELVDIETVEHQWKKPELVTKKLDKLCKQVRQTF